MKQQLLERWPTTLLAMACVMTGIWLGIEVTLLSRQPDLPVLASHEPPPIEIPPMEAYSLPPLEQYQNFVDKPLFIQGRTPVPPQDTEADTNTATTTSSTPPKLQLTGILDTPDLGTLVLLRSVDGKQHYRLKPGDDVENWRLSEVASDHVVLTSGAQKHTLKLLKPKPALPSKKPGFKNRKGTGPDTRAKRNYTASTKRKKP